MKRAPIFLVLQPHQITVGVVPPEDLVDGGEENEKRKHFTNTRQKKCSPN